MEVFVISKKNDRQLVNEQITSPQVLIIGPKGEQLGRRSREEALILADTAGFDLVLINPNAEPPVCKLMDYNKYKYEKNKRIKENLKRQKELQQDLKEFRFSVAIDKHDFDTRVNNAIKHLKKGNKIKGSIRLKGRQLAHAELGEQVLQRFVEALSEYSEIEQDVKVEFKTSNLRTFTVVVIPKKK